MKWFKTLYSRLFRQKAIDINVGDFYIDLFGELIYIEKRYNSTMYIDSKKNIWNKEEALYTKINKERYYSFDKTRTKSFYSDLCEGLNNKPYIKLKYLHKMAINFEHYYNEYPYIDNWLYHLTEKDFVKHFATIMNKKLNT